MVKPFIVLPSVGSGQARNQNFSLGVGVDPEVIYNVRLILKTMI